MCAAVIFVSVHFVFYSDFVNLGFPVILLIWNYSLSFSFFSVRLYSFSVISYSFTLWSMSSVSVATFNHFKTG